MEIFHLCRWYITSICFLLISSLSAAENQTILVFGDSLSDTGNCHQLTQTSHLPCIPPTPYYHQGRFSNGPIWIDYLKEDLKLPIINYAVGGAQSGDKNLLEFYGYSVGGLYQQIDRFVDQHKTISAETLVILQISANDFLSLLFAPLKFNMETVKLQIKQSIQNIKNVVERLHKLGATRIILWNLPDLGSLAKFNNGPPLNLLNSTMTEISRLFNVSLLDLVHQLNTALGEKTKIHHYDFHSVMSELLTEHKKNGHDPFVYILEATFSSPPKIYLNKQIEGSFFFYDDVHPTTSVWKQFSASFGPFVRSLIN